MPRILTYCLVCITLTVAAQAQQRYEVGTLELIGNDELPVDQLLSVIQTRETPWWLWKALYSKPEYYDPIVFDADFIRLRRFYENSGFYNARIDTSIRFDDASGMVDLQFRIQEGRRSYIDTLEYKGLGGLPPEFTDEVNSGKFIEVGAPFVLDKIQAELRRVVTLFANYGYVGVGVETPRATKYASRNNFSIVFSFTPGERYRFGQISVVQDTTSILFADTAIIIRHLDFVPGDFYSEAIKNESERSLNRLGLFEASRIDRTFPDSSLDQLEIPMRVSVRARPFNELTPEVGVNDKDQALTMLLGLGYNNRNFLGGARNFSTRLTLQVQAIGSQEIQRVFGTTGLKDSSLISTIDLSMQIVQPYFFSNKVVLTTTLSAILDKQRAYYNPILRARMGVTAQTATYTRLFVDWNLERIDPTSFGGTLDTTRLDLQRQFNSIETVTLQRDKRNDLFSPSEGFLHSISFEEAGLLPSAFGGLLGADLPYSQYYKISGIAQWYWDPTGGRKTIWAARLHGGFAELYGNPTSPAIPINRRFYAGGSSSVRGWSARTLGAMADSLRDFGGSALFEASMELRLNPLKEAGKFLFMDLSKISFVLFYDIGNVWSKARQVRVSELAMATGFGLRWDTVAGPIRIDFGMRVFDPFAAENERSILQKRFWKDTFLGGVLHLGIGHAF